MGCVKFQCLTIILWVGNEMFQLKFLFKIILQLVVMVPCPHCDVAFRDVPGKDRNNMLH